MLTATRALTKPHSHAKKDGSSKYNEGTTHVDRHQDYNFSGIRRSQPNAWGYGQTSPRRRKKQIPFNTPPLLEGGSRGGASPPSSNTILIFSGKNFLPGFKTREGRQAAEGEGGEAPTRQIGWRSQGKGPEGLTTLGGGHTLPPPTNKACKPPPHPGGSRKGSREAPLPLPPTVCPTPAAPTGKPNSRTQPRQTKSAHQTHVDHICAPRPT